MDLINNPEFRRKYGHCKKIIKTWEKQFKEENGRLPSKHDIREADSSIKYAYKKYFQLKTDALKDSLNDCTDFDFDNTLTASNISVFNDSEIYDSNTTIDSSQQEIPQVSTPQCIKELPHQDTPYPETPECVQNLPHQDTPYPRNVPEIDSTREEFTHNDKAWGEHLNKLPESNLKENKSITRNLTKKLSEKILGGTSKFVKRNPRKSISFCKQKSKLSIEDVKQATGDVPSPSQLEPDEKMEDRVENEVKFLQNTGGKVNQRPLNLLQSIDSEPKVLKQINRNWMERLSKQNHLDEPSIDENLTAGDYPEQPEKYGLSNLTFSSQFQLPVEESVPVIEPIYEDKDIIENSESDSEKPITQIRKKRRILPQKRIQQKSVEEIVPSCPKPEEIPAGEAIQVEKLDDKADQVEVYNENQVVKKKVVRRRVTKKKVVEVGVELPPKRKNLGRKVKGKVVVGLEPDSDEDPFNADSDNDPTFELKPESTETPELPSPPPKVKSIKTRAVKKSTVPRSKRSSVPKRKVSKKSQKEENEKTDEEEEGPIDVTQLTRTKLPETVPRFKSIKTSKIEAPNENTKVVKEKSEIKKNLNENFVRINIQKKVFARGKKSFTFQKYQKSKWLAKKKALSLAGPDMDMGGCDGGELKCFQCGGVGHFARQCKATVGEQLLSLDAANEEEKCPFPTLEEAYQSATESKLSIHTSRINMKQHTTGETQEEPHEVLNDSEIDAMFDDEPIEMQEIQELLEVIENQPLPSQPQEDPFKVKPLYELQPNGDVISTPDEVYEALNNFGFTEFRPGQEQAMMRILSGLSTLVTLSTGTGKSLCYQLPAYLYHKHRHPSLALVISPLISLMQDQVAQNERLACIHTGMTQKQRKDTFDIIKTGTIDALLISPEAIVAGLDSLIRKLPPISFACIDEVHCVSQWSYNFRPSYLTLCRVLRERLGIKTLLGLTATAPVTTQQSIMSHLGIKQGTIGSAPIPSNLMLTVSKDPRRDVALIALLKSNRLKDLKSIIVYCTRRNECERIAGMLRTYFQDEKRDESELKKKRKRVNWIAEPYHAGLAASRRRTIQNAFMSSDLKIVVATVAFGMGINKSDIRAVIHYNMPRNFESYVQEVGRAGRDGLPAHCHVFLDSEDNDQNELRRHIFSDSIDRHAIRKLLERVFIKCECGGDDVNTSKCPKHEVAFPIEETVRLLDIPEENISTLLCYLELHEKSYIQVLSNAYTWCKVVSYSGGSDELRKAAQTCPPLAMAIALELKKGNTLNSNTIQFPVVDVASAMGWDSGMVKCYLKNLEWSNENGTTKRSKITVELSSLGFRVRAAGDLKPTDLDLALDYLYTRVQNQEKAALIQLQKSFEAFLSVSTPSYNIPDEEVIVKSNQLKAIILNYFESDHVLPVEGVDDYKLKVGLCNPSQICQDVRAMMAMYQENNFTGRALARIFHGIPSPNYPAVIWGRCKYWRAHIKSDFNQILQIATREIIRLR